MEENGLAIKIMELIKRGRGTRVCGKEERGTTNNEEVEREGENQDGKGLEWEGTNNDSA